MRRTILYMIIMVFGFLLVGFTPDIGSDYAEYKRLPLNKRIERMQRSGEDLFLRRRYEDSIVVFETVLALKKNDLKAMLWITKANHEIIREKNDSVKEALYKKYNGYLIPEDKIYGNWKWDPSLGHFEVRYSQPKPKPPAKKARQKATDKEIATAIKKAETGSAEDLFEVAMLYWTRKDRENALKYFHDSYNKNHEILMYDDETMLMTVIDEVEEKISKNKANAKDYYEVGRLHLIQGDRMTGVRNLTNAVSIDKKLYDPVYKIFADFVDSPQTDLVSALPEMNGFRQAYVYEVKGDYIYLDMSLIPRNNTQVFSIDINLPHAVVKSIKSKSDDALFCYNRMGVDDSSRLWFVLPEKDEEFPIYDVRAVIEIDRKKAESIELSNFAMTDLYDNWSFVIGSDVNFASLSRGENESEVDGIRISGCHLPVYAGRGPYIKFSDFTEPVTLKTDIWKLMIPKEYKMENLKSEDSEVSEEGKSELPKRDATFDDINNMDIGL